MPIDSYKPRGPLKSASIDSGGADAKNYPIIGIVKDNIDPLRSGRIRVALQDGKGPLSPDDSSAWITVQYLTSFFGTVRPTSSNDDFGTYKGNPSSYGQWQAPPDIGTKVICIFVNGDINAGYYIGAIPETETLHMVPAFGASENVILNENEAVSLSGAPRLPVTNINTNNEEIADSDEFLEKARPVHSYTASVMSQQGIIRDPIRGPISSSASRETASRIGWGVSTPGRPIYEGGFDDSTLPANLSQDNAEKLTVVSRRGGHSIVMDDGDIIGRDQLIRIRTALGHQILMSDDGQTLMILHSNGQSYIELGKEGTVDIYSTNSINMRTEGDFNIHADRDINLHAEENFNLKAKKLNVNADEEINMKSGKDYKFDVGQNFTVKSKGAIALNSQGQASLASNVQTFINGSRINLNSGSAGIKAQAINDIVKTAHTDSIFDQKLGWVAAPGKLLSITSRTPAHCPWVGAGLGVDISNSPNAEDNLPQPTSEKVTQINREADLISFSSATTPTVATVPDVAPASKSLNKNILNSMLAASATIATGIGARELLRSSAGVTDQNKTATYGINSALQAASENIISSSDLQPFNPGATVGVYDRNPKSLEKSGILKPGADTIVNALIKSGKVHDQIIPEQLYSGYPGAENTSILAKNIEVQSSSMAESLKVAQQQLIEAGVITGNEPLTQTSGVITAAAILGSDRVIDLSNRNMSSGNSISDNSKMLSIISSSNLTVKNQESSGIFAGIYNSVDRMNIDNSDIDMSMGVSNSAFELIKKSFVPMQPGVPQNLSQQTKKAVIKSLEFGNSVTPTAPAIRSNTVDNNSVESVIGTPITNNTSRNADSVRVSMLPNIIPDFEQFDAIESVTGTKLNATSSFASRGTDLVNTLASGTSTLKSGPVGLSNAAKDVHVGSISNRAVQLASGITNIPGGLNNIASSGNQLTGQLGKFNVSQTISSAKSGITNALKNLVPAGAAAGLLSSIGAISTGGTSPIKLPSTAINTRNRSSQKQQVEEIINDPAIPKPDFGGEIDENAVSEIEEARKRLRELNIGSN